MKRNFVRLAVLVTIVLLLGMGASMGLTRAAPSERVSSMQVASSAPTPAAPAPSSRPTGQPATGARAAFAEISPAAPAAAAAAPAYNRVLSYVGNVLKPRENDVSYRISGTDEGCVYVASGNAAQIWNVPVTLPEGMQVQYLQMIYRDNSASTMYGWFTIYDAWGRIVQEWVIPSVNGSANQDYYYYQYVPISPPQTIDYSKYTYVINWQPNGPGEDLQLCGFQLYYYQPTLYLPLVTR